MKIPQKIIIFLCLVSHILCSHHCFSHTFYVDIKNQNSSDTNSGSLTYPWKTIQHAADNLMPGDTVFIREGTYHECIITHRSGNSTDGYITFSAYPRETPVIDGTDVTESNTGFTIMHSYINIKGLEIKNWINGIWMERIDNIIISDCEVHQVVYGIGAADGTHDFRLENVIIHHFDLYGFDASPSGGQDCYNGVVLNCIAYTGRDQTQNVDGFALGHGMQHNFVIDNCHTYNVFDGFDISSRNTSLIRCKAYKCWNSGFKIWQDSVELVNCLSYNNSTTNVEIDWNGNPKKVSLLNCTFHNADVYNIWIENSSDILLMRNCILSGGKNIGLAFEQHSSANYRGDYNLFHNDNKYRAIAVGYTDEFSLDQVRSGQWIAYSNQDSHSVTADSASQIFINPQADNFHLKKNSPAIDHGTDTDAPDHDFEGNLRPAGNTFDIGAYEYQPETDIHESDQNSHLYKNLTLYPNYPDPFNSRTSIAYYLDSRANVSLEILDINGRSIRTLIHTQQNAGLHQTIWDGRDNLHRTIASGVYFLKIKNSTCVIIEKMLFLK